MRPDPGNAGHVRCAAEDQSSLQESETRKPRRRAGAEGIGRSRQGTESEPVNRQKIILSTSRNLRDAAPSIAGRAPLHSPPPAVVVVDLARAVPHRVGPVFKPSLTDAVENSVKIRLADQEGVVLCADRAF